MVADQIEVSGALFVAICLKAHDGSPPHRRADSISNRQNSSHSQRIRTRQR
jgi:hypothetical protein